MGCCSERAGGEVPEGEAMKPGPQPTTKPSEKGPDTSKAPATEKKPEKKPDPPRNEIVLHVQPGTPPRFGKVFQILAGDTKIIVRETPDLKALQVKVLRYPVADFKGQMLVGERVVARFIATQNNHYPRTPEEVYECESLVDQITDMWTGLTTVNSTTLYAQAELLGRIEKRLKPGSKFFVGGKYTMADVFVFCFLTEFYLGDSVKEARGNAVPKRLQDFVAEAKTNALFRK